MTKKCFVHDYVEMVNLLLWMEVKIQYRHALVKVSFHSLYFDSENQRPSQLTCGGISFFFRSKLALKLVNKSNLFLKHMKNVAFI